MTVSEVICYSDFPPVRGRIGDTPTLGAGFWAEEWEEESVSKGGRNVAKTRASSGVERDVEGDDGGLLAELERVPAAAE